MKFEAEADSVDTENNLLSNGKTRPDGNTRTSTAREGADDARQRAPAMTQRVTAHAPECQSVSNRRCPAG